MAKFSLKFLLSLYALLVMAAGDLLAQCAMCRASVETNINEDGIGFAEKLNTGILYLFVMPYLMAVVIGYFWYKKSRERRRLVEEAENRKRRLAGL